MSQLDSSGDPAVQVGLAVGPASSRALVWVSWVVSLTLVVLVLVGREAATHPETAEETGRGNLVVQELIARIILGTREIVPTEANDLAKLLKIFPAETSAAQMCRAIVEGEIFSPRVAYAAVEKIAPTTPETRELHDILLRLYGDYASGRFDAPSVTADERRTLTDKLDWFGALALNPRPGPGRLAPAVGGAGAFVAAENAPIARERKAVLEPAIHTVVVLNGGIAGLIFLAVVGLFGLILLFNRARRGQLQHGLGDPVAYHGIYVETFALWMLLFVGLSALLPFLFSAFDLLENAGLAMVLSLVALIYPTWRGLSWRQVCQDIGWTAGLDPPREPIIGLFAYLLALPLMALGMLCFVAAATRPGVGFLIAANNVPSHPIVDFLIREDAWSRFKIYALACVAAPIVEETMFRGLLYRHVRDGTRHLGPRWSFCAGAFLVSLLFAAIHPQGPVAIPALAGLAIGFTIAREWRGTLIPSMIAHGIANGVMVTLAINALARFPTL